MYMLCIVQAVLTFHGSFDMRHMYDFFWLTYHCTDPALWQIHHMHKGKLVLFCLVLRFVLLISRPASVSSSHHALDSCSRVVAKVWKSVLLNVLLVCCFLWHPDQHDGHRVWAVWLFLPWPIVWFAFSCEAAIAWPRHAFSCFCSSDLKLLLCPMSKCACLRSFSLLSPDDISWCLLTEGRCLEFC